MTNDSLEKLRGMLLKELDWWEQGLHGMSERFRDGKCSGLAFAVKKIQEIIDEPSEGAKTK